MLIEPIPGIHSGIGSEVSQAFKDTSTNHIIAISGFKLLLIDALYAKNIGPKHSPELTAHARTFHLTMVRCSFWVVAKTRTN